MKKLLCTLLLSGSTLALFAQQVSVSPNANANAQRWKMDGNNANQNDFIGTVNEMPLNLRTNNQERLKITPDGRIGVGLTNPLAELHVNGNLRFSGDLTMEKHADPSLAESDFRIMGINRGGDATPLSGAELTKFFYGEPIPIECNTHQVALSNLKWFSNEDDMALYTTSPFVNCPDVKVGIGIKSPTQILDVAGNTRIRNNLYLGHGSETDFNPEARIHIRNTQSIVQGNRGDFLRFDQLGETVYKIDQNGKVSAREVTVTLKNIPDYVFLADYTLPSIKAQANFIKENGHLLHVPSEKEIIENNIGLGELTMANLKVSEEQMLYLIEMDTQMERLSEENATLKEKVARLELLMEKLLNEEK